MEPIDSTNMSLMDVLHKLGYDVKDSDPEEIKSNGKKLILKNGERRCYGRAHEVWDWLYSSGQIYRFKGDFIEKQKLGL